MALLFGRSELISSSFVQTAGYSMLAMGFGAFVLHAAEAEGAPTVLQSILRNRRLTKLGAYSYGFYVFHVPVIGAAKLLIVPHLPSAIQENLWFSLLFIAALGVVTFGISAASYELFEGPILSYKRYFGARWATSPKFSAADAVVPETPGLG
jgi:peptidoglycan/LPS O-acetylase OafA/YrhL